jgi:hypothetical protein
MLVSIDVGIKNLAVCVLDQNKILLWKILNLQYGTDYCSSIIKAFDAMDTMISGSDIIIERQMTKKMCNIQCYLEMYFRMKHHKNVVIYSPKYKLSGTGQENSGKGKKLYYARKKAAVELCKEWLDNHPQESWVHDIWKSAKKKDDLSDTLCMAIAFTTNPVESPAMAGVKKVTARKPTVKQDASGKYSKSNIKYLLQNHPKQKTLDGGEGLPVISKKLEKCVLKFWPDIETCWKELFSES